MSEKTNNNQEIEQESNTILRILGVDDDASMRTLEEVIFRRLGLDFKSAESAQQGLVILDQSPGHYNVVMSDRDMDGMNGEEFLKEVRLRYPDIQTALITGRKFDPEEVERMRQEGIDTYIQKPFSLEQIVEFTEKAKVVLEERNTKNDI